MSGTKKDDENDRVFRDRLVQEIEATPDEYLPALLNIVRTYCQSVTLNSAEVSFRQGWQEMLEGNTSPLSSLWDFENS